MRIIIVLLIVFVSSNIYSQDLMFKKAIYTWPDSKPEIGYMNNKYAEEDLVILDESIKFNLISRTSQDLSKNCIIKINSENGLKKISKISLPESFDESVDKHLYQQGKASKINAPYIYEFKLRHFAARVLKKDGTVKNLEPTSTTEKIYWIYEDGTHLQDFNYLFNLQNLEVGDIVEYNYKISFLGRYGYNIFYFNGPISKQRTTYTIEYYPVRNFELYDVICNSNVDAESYTDNSRFIESERRNLHTAVYKYTNLSSINYPVNTCVGKNLPHVFVDLNFLSFVGFAGNVPDAAIISVSRGAKFEWPVLNQLYVEEKIYDKQHASIRKYLSKICATDTTANPVKFLSELTDSLNNLKYISAEQMSYSGNAQYSVSSGEWLTKGKLIEEFMYELYWDLLAEKGFDKNVVCIQDKRLGEIKSSSRAEPKYENILFGITNNKSILLLSPRLNGLKYHLDEIPFYYEGVNAAMLNFDYTGINTNAGFLDIYTQLKLRYLIKTPSSTENENVRVENGVFKINLESSIIDASIKTNLNGQFSTIIRPHYLKNSIDSTINPVYFKKCTDKPNAFDVAIKTSSRSNSFPYKYSFTCSEKIKLLNNKEVSLKNWFSFTLNRSIISEKPNFDFYFDFRYTDMYNYMIEFNKPVEIANISNFDKNIQNDYFDLSSKLVKQSEISYLLSVSLKIKQAVLLQKDAGLLLELTNTLEELNSGVLRIK